MYVCVCVCVCVVCVCVHVELPWGGTQHGENIRQVIATQHSDKVFWRIPKNHFYTYVSSRRQSGPPDLLAKRKRSPDWPGTKSATLLKKKVCCFILRSFLCAQRVKTFSLVNVSEVCFASFCAVSNKQQ